MVEHSNKSIIQNFNEIFKFKNGDMPQNEVMPVISPVVQVQPYINFIRTANFTTETNRDTFITDIHISVSGDNDLYNGYYNFTFTAENGETYQYGLECSAVSQNMSQSLHFSNRGLKLKRGSVWSGTSQGAKILICGYTEEIK